MKTIHIVGGGSAGLAAAYFIDKKKYNVIVYDKNISINKRKCPSIENKSPCSHCPTCSIISGIGGAGLFSDGKMIFNSKVGLNLGDDICDDLNFIKDNFFKKFFTLQKIEVTSLTAHDKLKERILTSGHNYIYSNEEYHVGTDVLKNNLISLLCELTESGVQFGPSLTLEDIERGKVCKDNIYLIATGRAGHRFARSVLDRYEIGYSGGPVDIGVRVEAINAPYEYNVTQAGVYDLKLRIRTSNEDVVRTFCVNPSGLVAAEHHDGFLLANGYANSTDGVRTDNVNFAMLVKLNLGEKGNEIAELIATTAYKLGNNNLIVQRVRDLWDRRRTTEDRLFRSRVIPTYPATPGDLTLCLPQRILQDIQEGMAELDKIVPGINIPDTLLYGVEAKLHGYRVDLDDNMCSSDPQLYFLGDVAGYSRGIVGSALTGYMAARHING